MDIHPLYPTNETRAVLGRSDGHGCCTFPAWLTIHPQLRKVHLKSEVKKERPWLVSVIPALRTRGVYSYTVRSGPVISPGSLAGSVALAHRQVIVGGGYAPSSHEVGESA